MSPGHRPAEQDSLCPRIAVTPHALVSVSHTASDEQVSLAQIDLASFAPRWGNETPDDELARSLRENHYRRCLTDNLKAYRMTAQSGPRPGPGFEFDGSVAAGSAEAADLRFNLGSDSSGFAGAARPVPPRRPLAPAAPESGAARSSTT